MTVYFITGNDSKWEEAKAILPALERLRMDLPEIQSADPCEIITAKLREAQKRHDGALIVEDTSLAVESMNGLPGPLVKWFLMSIGAEGIYLMAKHRGDCSAEGRAIVGYASGEDVKFFEGSVRGTLVAPRVDGFGWDTIFVPDGHDRTFAEMTKEEKNAISHRRRALERLREIL